jgi:tRNA dimethylallyltransferase
MIKSQNWNLVTILGHTAAGKTAFAAHLADRIHGEIISADSRQVYKGMNLGTGKDYDDYLVDGKRIPHHLIDIAEPGYEYNVYEFSRDFIRVYNDIYSRGLIPVLCGGTGLYLESVLRGYQLINVPVNNELREKAGRMPMEELETWLASLKTLHNTTDTVNRKRLTRAIEIELYYKEHKFNKTLYPTLKPVIFGIRFEREERRERITQRLKQRLDEGMADEVKQLTEAGIHPEKLEFYGLEYKYLTWYITGRISYEDMFRELNTAIHRFAKRQMTWFRKMEREGTVIHWLEGHWTMEKKLAESLAILKVSAA